MKKIIFIIFVLGYYNFATANDGFLSGTIGGNVFLSKNDSIQMIKEVIYVNMYRDSCNVSCRFWFINKGTTTIDTVGFPDFWYAYLYKTKPIKHFSTVINGKIVTTERKKELNDKDTLFKSGKYWYTWTCNFPKNDTVIIDNSYTAYWGTSPFGYIEFSYIIGTATSWLGPIKEGQITLNHESIGSQLFTRVGPYHQLENNAFKILESEDNVVISFKDYIPEKREGIQFSIYSYWAYPHPIDESNSSAKTIDGLKYLLKIPLSGHIKSGFKVQDMINEIYAREGYVFQDKRTLDYYKSKKWYKPNNHAKLSSYENIFISALKELEQKDDNR